MSDLLHHIAGAGLPVAIGALIAAAGAWAVLGRRAKAPAAVVPEVAPPAAAPAPGAPLWSGSHEDADTCGGLWSRT